MAKMNIDIEDGDHDLQPKHLPKKKKKVILKYINIWILKNKCVWKYNGKGKD